MDIKGLNTVQISQQLAVYLESHIQGFKLSEGESLFQENFTLHFQEVKENIPTQHHHLFNDSHKFNVVTGFITAGSQVYILSLLADENYTTAYFLFLQEAKGEQKNIIIRNFLVD